MDVKGLVDQIPTPDSSQVAGGGLVVFTIWFVSQVWKGYKEFRRERIQKIKDGEDLEKARQARIAEGFSGVDKSRNEEIERLNLRIDQDAKRHADEIARMQKQYEELHRRCRELQDNRDEGWDKGRFIENVAHRYRHAYLNLLQQTWAYGKVGAGMPPEIQAVYDLGAANKPLPEEIKAPTIPELQFAPRRPAPELPKGE